MQVICVVVDKEVTMTMTLSSYTLNRGGHQVIVISSLQLHTGSSDLPGTTLGEGRASRSFVTANCTGGEASLVNCMLTAASSCDADNIAGVTCAYNSGKKEYFVKGMELTKICF